MKIKFYAALILCFATVALSAQGQREASSGASTSAISVVSIRATVVDSANNQPIEFASVRLFNSKTNQLAQGAVTSQNGRIELKNVKPGGYYLLMSFCCKSEQKILNKLQPLTSA